MALSTSIARERRSRRISAQKDGSNDQPPMSSGNKTMGSRIPATPHAVEGSAANFSKLPSLSRRRNQQSAKSYRKPPIVSPIASKSLDSCGSEPENLNRISSDRSVSSEFGLGNRNGGYLCSDRSVVSESNLYSPEEMPMDEVEADLRSVNSRVEERRRAAGARTRTSRSRRLPMGIYVESSSSERKQTQHAADDDVSSLGGMEDSLGGVEDQVRNMQRITNAIRNKSARPSNLTVEAKELWDTIQAALRETIKDASSKEVNSNNSAAKDGEHTWEEKCTELKQQLNTSHKENDHSLGAMSRVLADVTLERDKAARSIEELKEHNDTLVRKNREMQRQLDCEKKTVVALEREMTDTRESQCKEIQTLRNENGSLKSKLEEEREQLSKMKQEHLQLEEKSSGDISFSLSSSCDNTVLNNLRKELEDKSSALETSKMIIASLENASGSHAADMKSKLRAREDEVATLKYEASQRQKMLDSLAKDLRDAHKTPSRSVLMNNDRALRLALTSRLEKNLSDLQASCVILESTQDPAAMDDISDILSESIAALKSTMDEMENVPDDSDDCSDAGSITSRSSYGSSMSRSSYDSSSSQQDMCTELLRRELKEKKSDLKRMVNKFKLQKDEIQKLRSDSERAKQMDDELNALRSEVQNLRKQCSTNLEVLTKKERELAVLRDSLKVEDECGYISDDGSEGSEDPSADQRALAALGRQLNTSNYGVPQTEALATILAQGGGNALDIDAGDVSGNDETECLKRELFKLRSDKERSSKELKAEKESLANAKLIISSLEKANKSMMEDLQSRLQDSNSAIASLLEKSMEGEKTAGTLRAELDAVRKEKEELQLAVETLPSLGSKQLPRDFGEEKKEDFPLHQGCYHTTETID